MVKLPVIVYNRKSQSDVYGDAINIRRKLEAQAKAEQIETGRYIRPIVLFQAQPRIGAESTTYDKIKSTLIEAGIPQEEIAIKTGDKDELKNVDLLSSDCPIRYIITVNALKEGWDCPFAYVLATVANRTSTVDVEQILGRVLRLPYTKKNKSNVLNISYVITSSVDFGKTLDNVVKGLNSAGFSEKDYRTKDVDAEVPEPITQPTQNLFDEPIEEELPEVDTGELRRRIEAMQTKPGSAEDIESDDMLAVALAQNEAYEEMVSHAEDSSVNNAPTEVRDKMNVFRMNEEFAEEAVSLRFPQFMMKVGPSFFADEYVELKLEHLEDGFTLKDKDTLIDFSTVDAEMARVDIDDSKDAVPKVWKINGTDSAYYKEWFNSQPSEVRLAHCKGMIKKRISKMNSINDRELQSYIDRVVENMTEDQLSDMEQSPYPYIKKIEDKVKVLLAAHRMNMFDLWLEQGKIECRPNYTLQSTISPSNFFSSFPKSLYTSEEDVNDYERKVVWQLSSMENIKWWHRNISRQGFQINGAVHAYPDIIAMTDSGKILMIETKGNHLENIESKTKAVIGSKWDALSGNQYRYFMVFETKSPDYPGAYSYDRFLEIIEGL